MAEMDGTESPDAGEDSNEGTADCKTCIECKAHKHSTEFPRNRRRLDGRDNRCKRCTARMVSERLKQKEPITEPTVSHKACSRCSERKLAAEFNNNKVSPDGLCSYCKPCNAAAAAERRKRRAPVPEPTVATKICSHCKEAKSSTEFHKSKSYKDGLFGQCKDCCALAAAKRAKPLVVAPTVVSKGCSRCGALKDATAFNINKTTSSGLTSHCKECIAAAAAERKKLKSLVTEPTVAFKVCGHCKERKGAAEFHRTRTRSDGLSSSCKVCRNSQSSAGRSSVSASAAAEGSSLRGGSPDTVGPGGLTAEGMSDEVGACVTGDGGGGAKGGPSVPGYQKPQFMLTAAALQLHTVLGASQLFVSAVEGAGTSSKVVHVAGKEQSSVGASVDVQATVALEAAPAAVAAAPLAAPAGYAGLVKQCRRCGIERPTKDFHRQQSRPDGLYSYCVFCASEYKQARKLSRNQRDHAEPTQSAAVPGGSSDDSDCMLPAKLRQKQGRRHKRSSAVEAAIAGASSAESAGASRRVPPPAVALFEKPGNRTVSSHLMSPDVGEAGLHPAAYLRAALAPGPPAAVQQAHPGVVGASLSPSAAGSVGRGAAQAVAAAAEGPCGVAVQLAGSLGSLSRTYERQLSRDSCNGLPPLWEEGSLAAATALFGGTASVGAPATMSGGGARWVAAEAPPAVADPGAVQRDGSPDVKRRSSSDSEAGGQRRADPTFGQNLFQNPGPGALNPESSADPLPNIPMWEFDTSFARGGSLTNGLSLTGNLDVSGSLPGFSPRFRAGSVPRGVSPEGPALSWNGAQHMAGSTYGPPGAAAGASGSASAEDIWNSLAASWLRGTSGSLDLGHAGNGSVHGGGSWLRGTSGSYGSDLNFLRGMSPPARDEEPEVMQAPGPPAAAKQDTWGGGRLGLHGREAGSNVSEGTLARGGSPVPGGSSDGSFCMPPPTSGAMSAYWLQEAGAPRCRATAGSPPQGSGGGPAAGAAERGRKRDGVPAEVTSAGKRARHSSPPETAGERLQSHSISSADLCAPASAAAAAASLPIVSLDAGIFSVPLMLPLVSQLMARQLAPLGNTHMQPLTSAFSAIAASWPAAMPYLPAPNTLPSASLPFNLNGASLEPLSEVATAAAAQRLQPHGANAKVSMQTAAEQLEGRLIEDGMGDRPSSGESAADDNHC